MIKLILQEEKYFFAFAINKLLKKEISLQMAVSFLYLDVIVLQYKVISCKS